MFGALPFYEKAHWNNVWCLTISWQDTLLLYLGLGQFTLLLCLVLDHFMKKNTATKFGTWPFHDKAYCYYVWCLTISWQNTLLLCLVLDHFMIKHTATMSGAWPIHDKQTDNMSGAWSFHDKTHCYYVWCLTISWQNTLLQCLVLDHFMTKHTAIMSGAWPIDDKQTDTMSGAWPFHDKIQC
jgi:hypothetical protein